MDYLQIQLESTLEEIEEYKLSCDEKEEEVAQLHEELLELTQNEDILKEFESVSGTCSQCDDLLATISKTEVLFHYSPMPFIEEYYFSLGRCFDDESEAELRNSLKDSIELANNNILAKLKEQRQIEERQIQILDQEENFIEKALQLLHENKDINEQNYDKEFNLVMKMLSDEGSFEYAFSKNQKFIFDKLVQVEDLIGEQSRGSLTSDFSLRRCVEDIAIQQLSLQKDIMDFYKTKMKIEGKTEQIEQMTTHNNVINDQLEELTRTFSKLPKSNGSISLSDVDYQFDKSVIETIYQELIQK